MLTCRDIINKRRELWEEDHDPNQDELYRFAVAEKLTEESPQGEKLRAQASDNPTLLIEMLFVIDDKEGKTVPFFPNEAQQMVKQEYLDSKFGGKPFRALILKGRQQGISSWITSLQLAIGITTNNFQGYTVADEDKSTNNLFEKAKSYYAPLPGQIKPTEKYNNRKEFRWAKENGGGLNSSWGIATAGVSRDGRVGNSFTIHFLHASETAWWKNIDKTLSGLTDACTPFADIILETTAHGYNDFQERWEKAEKGLSEYKPIFIPWYIQSEYSRGFDDDKQRQDFLGDLRYSNFKVFKNLRNYRENIPEVTLENLWWYYRKYMDDKNEDLAEMQQEYPTFPEEAFQASGNPVFNLEEVKRKRLLAEKKRRPIKAFNAHPIVRNTDNIKDRVAFDFVEVDITANNPWPKADIYIFEEPKPDEVYVLGADVAEGNENGDYSSASIWPIEGWKQAVQINGHWEADEYGYLLFEYGKRYNWAYMMVENNNHGLTTNTTIYKELGYPEGRFHFRYSQEDRSDKQSRKMGWWTGNNKFLMIDEFRTAAINGEEMFIRDYKTFAECMTYVKDEKGSYNAESGNYDDRIIDKAIAWQGRKYVTAKMITEDTISWDDW
jgi:hypothetical protein